MSTAPDPTAAVLVERGARYGRFDGHATVTQCLKTIIASGLRTRDKILAPDQQEALDMICHKIGRIINGDANYDDSWVDIAGYARLVADRLQGKGEHAPRPIMCRTNLSPEAMKAIAAAGPGDIVQISDMEVFSPGLDVALKECATELKSREAERRTAFEKAGREFP
jgi:hypothetical protein